jgi:diaminohydroxyphosphoribosylaminopyrimidine deaminase/5-amino-6-(5-phosphoribosylamino)uracil reductase
MADDAELTVRHCAGRQPLRVVLDRDLSLPLDAKIFNAEAKTLVFASADGFDHHKETRLRQNGVEVITAGATSGGLDLRQILEELHRRQVLSVLVEGGSRLSAAFVRSGLADKLYMFLAPKLFGSDGLSSFAPVGVERAEEAVNLSFERYCCFGPDLMIEAYFQ